MLTGWPAGQPEHSPLQKELRCLQSAAPHQQGPLQQSSQNASRQCKGSAFFYEKSCKLAAPGAGCRCLGMQQQASVLSSRLAPAIPALPPASTAYALQNTCSSAVAGLPGRHSRAISESLSSFLPWKKAVNSFMTAASCVSLHSTAQHSVRQVSAVLSWSQALEGSAGCNQPPDQQPSAAVAAAPAAAPGIKVSSAIRPLQQPRVPTSGRGAALHPLCH